MYFNIAPRDFVEIEVRTLTENIGTGFTEQWISLGTFDATVTQEPADMSAFQMQASTLSKFKVKIPDGPTLTYAHTRFKWFDSNGVEHLLEPVRDPLYYGSSRRRDVVVICQNVLGMEQAQSLDTTTSLTNPPTVNRVYRTATFTGDGITTAFYPPRSITADTSIVTLGSAGQLRGVDYEEYSDRIVFLKFPPADGDSIRLKYQ